MEKVQGETVQDFEMGREKNYWTAFQSLEPPGITYSCRRGVLLFIFEKSFIYIYIYIFIYLFIFIYYIFLYIYLYIYICLYSYIYLYLLLFIFEKLLCRKVTCGKLGVMQIILVHTNCVQ